MSGHSKWATTHRQKEIKDAKRGAVFTRMANIISIAARKGGDPDTNFSLRLAIDRAKATNMPKENIERAIKRGTGELDGAQIEELFYEGVGPANTQFIVKCLTDNKNRTASEIRHLFSEHNGSLSGVMWNFDKKGVLRIIKEEMEKGGLSGDDAELEMIDEGAEDIKREEEGLTIITAPENLDKMKKFLEAKSVKMESVDIEYVAKTKQELAGEDKEKAVSFIEVLDDNQDVTDYYSNVNF